MDPHLAFWTAALVDLFAVTVCAVLGVRRVRSGDPYRHRRLMQAAAAGVVLFLAAYLVKLALLGHEDRSLWDARSLAVLRIHETFVTCMLIAGGFAVWRSRSFGEDLARFDARDPSALRARRQHRIAGRIGVVGALLGFATAALVLAGMFARARG